MRDFNRDYVWNRAEQAIGFDPVLYRRDFAGKVIYWYAYGDRNHVYGWEVGHIIARADGGSDAFFNLQAEHWMTNLEKEEIRRNRETIPLKLLPFISNPRGVFGNPFLS